MQKVHFRNENTGFVRRMRLETFIDHKEQDPS